MMDEGAYCGGAYRLHRPEDVERYTCLATAAFPAFRARISCFGADWLGRQFALDQGRVIAGEPQVLMLEPGTGEALEIPISKVAFHEEELAQYADAAVAESFYQKWLGAGGEPPRYHQCVGYNVPLFLGGTDEVSNLQVMDLEVYWTISAQLLEKVRDLPVGTPVARVTISD